MLVIELLQARQPVLAFQSSPPQMASIRTERQLNSANIGQILIHCLLAANRLLLKGAEVRVAVRHTVDLLLKLLPRSRLPPVVLTVLIRPAALLVEAVGELERRFGGRAMQGKRAFEIFALKSE